MDRPPLTFKAVLALAIPASIAAMVTPLLGLADTIILGYSDRPLDIGGIGLAAAVFSLAYWTFGFLRMSTAGMAAQAAGAGDEKRARRVLAQSAGLGGILGILFLCLQTPFKNVAFALMTGDATLAPETVSAAHLYYDIRIWGAPFVLVTYGLLGWMTARGRADLLMAVSVFMTLLNIALDAWFVMGLNMGPAGIAWGTLIAEISGCCAALGAVCFILHRHGGLKTHWRHIRYFHLATLKRLFGVNLDIFIRTFILVCAFLLFTRYSAIYGDYILSTNHLLMQFFLITGLALDGPAIAAETLVGQSFGTRNKKGRKDQFQKAVQMTAFLTLGLALSLALFYGLFRNELINIAAPDPEINALSRDYFFWIMISPLVVGTCFFLDGVYIGATRTAAIRNGMVASGLIYLLALYVLPQSYENHGLWAAFMVFMMARAITLLAMWRGFEPLIDQGPVEEASSSA